MCFSARVSFGAAVALSAIGVVAVRSVRSRRLVPLASIPFLFAAQQACEGGVWLVLERAPFHVQSTPLARAFLFFALFVWPAYVPAALFFVEPARARRAVLLAFTLVGTALGAYLMGCASLRASNACIAADNLYYWVQIDTALKPIMPFAYLSAIAAPLVISSVPRTSILAAVVIASFAMTGMLYRVGFASVWCFFAAILSGVVVLITRGFGDGFADARQPAR